MRINENQKVTLTIKQLKRLVKEANDAETNISDIDPHNFEFHKVFTPEIMRKAKWLDTNGREFQSVLNQTFPGWDSEIDEWAKTKVDVDRYTVIGEPVYETIDSILGENDDWYYEKLAEAIYDIESDLGSYDPEAMDIDDISASILEHLKSEWEYDKCDLVNNFCDKKAIEEMY